MTDTLEWVSRLLDLISAILVIILWRSYRRKEAVAPQIYLATMLFSALFLGLYIAAMPAGQWVRDIRFAGPAAAIGFLWGLTSSRGMIIFRVKGCHFMKGSLWMPLWATLNLGGSKLLEEFGEGLWGLGGMIVMLIVSMATIASNLALLVALIRVQRFYRSPGKRGGRFHFCHACGTGYERWAKVCPACGARKQRVA
ncbi:MAG TPA: zinc ribbon domain-containing protein [Symbiobacteriaceae bacterium]|nr:zinc ribbon domain-containing protein [Symbiobacteriaceae bacterium]